MSGCATGGVISTKDNSFFFHFLSFLSYFSFSYILQMTDIHDISIIKVMITTLYFFIFIYFSCSVVGIELACWHGTQFLSSYCICISRHDRLILPIITARCSIFAGECTMNWNQALPNIKSENNVKHRHIRNQKPNIHCLFFVSFPATF